METVTDILIRVASGCGLHCATCTLYIGTTEEPKRLEIISSRLNVPVEELECNGCKSDKRSMYCQSCNFLKCLAEHNLDYCGQCVDYPCTELVKFKADRPHRKDLWVDMHNLLVKGIDEWNKEVLQKYTCPVCGTINSAYDLACRKCSNLPSSNFVRKNNKEIINSLKH
jgi:hypothetical protein